MNFVRDAGRQLRRDGRYLVYDDAPPADRCDEGDRTIAHYRYDALGNRIAKTVDGRTTYYLYDTAHRMIAETDGAGNIRRQYLYAGYRPYAVLQAQGGT